MLIRKLKYFTYEFRNVGSNTEIKKIKLHSIFQEIENVLPLPSEIENYLSSITQKRKMTCLFLFPHQKIELTFSPQKWKMICLFLFPHQKIELTFSTLKNRINFFPSARTAKWADQKTEYVLSWQLGILDCNTEMGNEITFYPANKLKMFHLCQLGIVESTFKL